MEQTVQHLREGRAVVVYQSLLLAEVDETLLSRQEKQRAESFSHPPSRRAFLAGRTLLRKVLNEFAVDVQIQVGPHGKPYCADLQAPEFNLSHTSEDLLAVFSFQGPVGADIESTDREPKHPQRLAEKVFTPLERQQLSEGQKDFLSLWTRKEALLKAMGTGFSGGALKVETEDVLRSSGWKVKEFRQDRVLGAMCVPDSVPLVMPSGLEVGHP